MGNSRRPTPALFVALIALVVALAGTATALPGKNTVDKNDIKKNAVKSKAIKNGQVKAADLAANSVDGSKIVDGAVAAAEIADSEAPHLIGAAGEPAYGNGGDGDCLWQTANALVPGLSTPAFYKDALGIVHLRGLMIGTSTAVGDGVCDPTDPGEEADGVAYILPPGYRPDGAEVQGPDDAYVLIAGDQPLSSGLGIVPAGGVFAASGLGATAATDGITFRPAGPAAAKANAQKKPAKTSLAKLRKLRG